ncbi:hypothetical protein [Duganella sp. P38]
MEIDDDGARNAVLRQVESKCRLAAQVVLQALMVVRVKQVQPSQFRN